MLCRTGDTRYKQQFSKRKKEWTVSNIYTKKTYSFRKTLVQKLIERRLDKSVSYQEGSMEMTMPLLPANLGSLTVPKPAKKFAAESHMSRFSS